MKNKKILTKKCKVCGKTYEKPYTCGLPEWKERKFCSAPCRQKGKDSSHLKRYYIKKGQSLSKKTQFKKGETAGEKNAKWKGDKASYWAKHIWVSQHFNKTGICEICGESKQIKNAKYGTQWSNISGKYLRIRTDWRELCVKCHKNLDLKRIYEQNNQR